MLEIITSTWTYFTGAFAAILLKRIYSGDGREEATLKYVQKNAKNNPESVLQSIDDFGRRTLLMTIGITKGALLGDALMERNPKVALELGSYVGYSATLIGSKLRPGAKVICMEIDPSNANITKQVTDFAGLSDKVEVVVGSLDKKIEEVKEVLQAQNAAIFDFVFIDHDKNRYVPDLLLLKEHGLIGKGTVLFADNIRMPGAPEYKKYIEEHTDEYESTSHTVQMSYFMSDVVLISKCQ